MATPRQARSSRPIAPRLHCWTRREYNRLATLDLFRNRRVELLGGRIVELSPSSPAHAAAVSLVFNAIAAAFGAGHYVRTEGALDLDVRSQPEPDVAVYRGAARDFVTHHPTAPLLVVEVSESSLRYDRGPKARLYARAGIADSWIVNLVDRQLEIRRKPGPDPDRPGRFAYREVAVVPASGLASPLAAPGASLAVADLLP